MGAGERPTARFEIISQRRLEEESLDPARDRPVALILGNEKTGLNAATLALCHEVVRIPGSGRLQSLNVANAAAILIYLLTRSPSG